MKVKTFIATNMQEAIAQVKQNMGTDAVILHTRKSKKGGFFGWFGRDMFEVTAAVEEVPLPVKATPTAGQIVSRRSVEEESKGTAIQLELATMRKLIEQLMHKIPATEVKSSAIRDILLENDVEPQIADNLLMGLPEEGLLEEDAVPVLRKVLVERMCNYLQRISPIEITEDGCKVVALIGPTGVGKTTTIAKLAASFAIKKGYKVALITADTYRIAAVEQLRTYSDIMGIPIDIVYSPDELRAALFRHQDKQLVLIDTAGRSPHNQYQLAELQAMLAVDPSIEVHLVMSAMTKYVDLLEMVNKFSVCSPQKFLFTKVDEARNIGTILNLLYRYPASLSYITNGQNVPDDIDHPTPEDLASMILRDHS